MAIPNQLNQTNLDHARSLLDHGKLTQMYDYLSSQGYRYATLANGVAKGDTISGLAALEFMDNTAQQQGRTLTGTEVQQIRIKMAEGYLNTLQAQIDSTGVVTREIDFNEAWHFHSVVFEENNLSPDAWTLNTPFNVMVDDASRQAYWEGVLGSVGDPVKEGMLALSTLHTMELYSTLAPDAQASQIQG